MPRDEIINLALRRGLFYRAAEIYANSPAGFWDFGPIGETIRRKIIDFWRNEFVEAEGMVEIYGSQILPKEVFVASGHLENFNDPVVKCKKCNSVFRVDYLLKEYAEIEIPETLPLDEYEKLIAEYKIACPNCLGSFGKPFLFNLMMKVAIGAAKPKECYLRPETCQTIFLNFARLYKIMRKNLPFGIAQAGCSFRNEISPRNVLLRERELGQMEAEIFFNPEKINNVEHWEDVENYELNLFLLKDKRIHKITCQEAVESRLVSGKIIAYYLARVQQLYEKYGLENEKLRFRELSKEERPFYAIETWDFEVETEDFGFVELAACNYRSDYDLRRHAKFSKKDLKVKEDGKEFYPHVFEISIGLDRTFYVLIDNAFRKELRGKEERIYLDLNPKIAPYLAGIFPLVKKDSLDEIAQNIYRELLSYRFDVLYDAKGSIGKRYARIDEIGVPYAITVDYQTKEDNTVTLRERNSMQQKRVKIKKLPEILWHLKLGKITFDKIK